MTAPQRVPNGPTNRPNLHTSTELAQAIARIELDATRTLSRRVWMTSAQVFDGIHKSLPKMRSKAANGQWDRFDLETALDCLVTRGLAEAEREDAQVTETRPQRYRWTRYATVEALTRYASTSRRCERAGCEKRITGDNSRERYCSRTCANTESFARRGGRAK